jgi:hypothetical protein
MIAKQRGQLEVHIQLSAFPNQEIGGSQKFQIYQRSLQPFPENVENIIFATCILHTHLRDQGLGLSYMVSSANVRSNLTKIRNQGGSAFEVSDKFKQL